MLKILVIIISIMQFLFAETDAGIQKDFLKTYTPQKPYNFYNLDGFDYQIGLQKLPIPNNIKPNYTNTVLNSRTSGAINVLILARYKNIIHPMVKKINKHELVRFLIRKELIQNSKKATKCQ